MSPFNQPKGMVAYGDMKVMLNYRRSDFSASVWAASG